MKYFLFVVSLIALIITAGCVVQNDNPTTSPTPQIVYVTVFVTPTQTAFPTYTSQSVYLTETPMADRIAEVSVKINAIEADLQVFRSHIDEKNALGIDTAVAEIKYNEALQKINIVKRLPATQYTQAFSNLNAAQMAIDDGEAALDYAWAVNEVTKAQIPINKVDAIIVWFKRNSSTANDQQLPAIIAKREVAVSYLSTATDEINNGKYNLARAKAHDAYTKGNEAYNDALARQKQLVSEN